MGKNLSRLFGSLASIAMLAALGCGERRDVPGMESSCLSFVGPEVAGIEVNFEDAFTEVAESFKFDANSQPTTLELKLRPFGLPRGKMIVKIEADVEGQPSGVALETATLEAEVIRPSGAVGDQGERYYSLTFPAPAASLSANKTYWVRVKGAASFTSEDGVSWIGNDTGAYSRGTVKSSSDGTHFSGGLIGRQRSFFYKLGC